MGGERSIVRAMTTINNQDDFLEALRNNPQWRDAVRAQILGEELLQLPVKFDAFVEEHRTTHINTDARLDRIKSDTGTLKGDFARTRTVQDAQGIASDMGLELVRTLSTRDLSEMAGNTLSRDVGRSFRNADLVIEATDGTDTRYIAMEISFTADRRDCYRAIRNAGLITRFTGKPVQAASAIDTRHRGPVRRLLRRALPPQERLPVADAPSGLPRLAHLLQVFPAME